MRKIVGLGMAVALVIPFAAKAASLEDVIAACASEGTACEQAVADYLGTNSWTRVSKAKTLVVALGKTSNGDILVNAMNAIGGQISERGYSSVIQSALSTAVGADAITTGANIGSPN